MRRPAHDKKARLIRAFFANAKISKLNFCAQIHQSTHRSKMKISEERYNWLLLWCALLLTLAFIAPNHYPPWRSFHGELLAAVAFMPLMLWAAWPIRPAPALAIAILSLGFVPLIQAGLGQIFFIGDAFMAWLYLAGTSLCMLAGWRWTSEKIEKIKTPQGPRTILIALVLTAHLSTGIALAQWTGLTLGGIFIAEVPPGDFSFGNLAQPNQLATLLLLGIAAHLALFEARRLRASIALFGIAFLIFGIVLTGSRSVVLALIWFLPAYGFMRHRCKLRTTPAAVICMILCFFTFSLLWQPMNQWLLFGTNEAGNVFARLNSAGVRSIIWSSMIDAILRSPWQGYGWMQICLAQNATALDYPAPFLYFYSAHNLFIDLLLWNGIPVGGLVILGLLIWFIWQIRQCRDPASWSMLISIGFVFSHAMVEFPLNYTYFLFPIAFLMGILSKLHPTRLDGLADKLTLKSQHIAFLSATAVGAILSVKVTTEYPIWEQDWRDLRFQEARIGNPQRGKLPNTILLNQLDESMRFARAEPHPGMTDAELDRMRKVSSRFGYASAMYRYALALALNQRPKEAELTLQKLCYMHPPALCHSAQRDWEERSQSREPQLAQVHFPPIPD